jgi:urease accessory protein
MRPTETPILSRHDQGIAPGRGHVVVEQVGGRSVVASLRAHSPLKLLAPRHRASYAAWIVAGSYGGGLVGGDELCLDVRAGPGTTVLLGTQASTKVYRPINGRGCRQTLTVNAAADSICVSAPDPVTPFEDARYEQRQRFELAASASLICVDWFSAGRCARGERWRFERYESRMEIVVEGKAVLREALLLDAGDGPIDAATRTGGFDCFAIVVILGPSVAGAASRVLSRVDRLPLGRANSLTFAASPIAGGVVLRVAGTGVEAVGRWLRHELTFIVGLLGEDPWLRKW